LLKECLEVFNNMLNVNGDKLVTDGYVPKRGTYRLIEMLKNGKFNIIDTFDIYYEPKEKVIVNSDKENFKLICLLDYYSKLITMNKSIGGAELKKIHSNNYLSLAMKKETITEITDDILERYYKILKEPSKKYASKKLSLIMYEELEKKIGLPDAALLKNIKDYVLQRKWLEDINLDKKEYLKVFFILEDRELTKSLYKKESERYTNINIFNSDKSIRRLDDDTIIGLPSNNINTNTAKPFLLNQTKKEPFPILITQDQALLQYKFFDYLWSKSTLGKTHIYVGETIECCSNFEVPENFKSGYYIRIRKDRNEVIIEDARVIPSYCSVQELVVEDYFNISDLKIYHSYSNLLDIKKLIDNIFFEGNLKYGLDIDVNDLKFSSAAIKKNYFLCRDSLMEWFYKSNDYDLYGLLNDVTFEIIRQSIVKNYFTQAKHQMNVRWALLYYLKGNKNQKNTVQKDEEIMYHVRQILKEHINLPSTETWEFSSENEYAYAVGQAVNYLLSLSKTGNRDEAVINTFLSTKNVKVIREKLLQMYKKYNHGIVYTKESRFGKMVAAIMEYEPKNINSEMIMAGLVSNCLIYEKIERKEI